MALSVWGKIPDDLDYDYEALHTPSEQEIAETTKAKVATLIEVFKNHGMTQQAFIKELMGLKEESGMFTTLDDKMADEGEGVWFKDLDGAMNDPFAGIDVGAQEEGESPEQTPPEPPKNKSNEQQATQQAMNEQKTARAENSKQTERQQRKAEEDKNKEGAS
jgi:hypothetical protein